MIWNIFNKKIYFKVKRSSFTLIEILIVMATIGLISTSAVAVIDPINLKNKANDSERLADIEKIKIAQEEYVNDKGCYPSTNPVLTQNFDSNSFLYVTDGSSCPKWYVLFSEIISYKKTTNACDLDLSCLPLNYQSNWSCYIAGNYKCDIIANTLLPGISIPTSTPVPIPTSIPVSIPTITVPTKSVGSTAIIANCIPIWGKGCTRNQDCCTGHCLTYNNGLCSVPLNPTVTPAWNNACKTNDSSCTNSNQCCSGSCSNLDYWPITGKCCGGKAGATCTTDTECCSYLSLFCVSGTCQKNNTTKLPIGSTCRQSSQCSTGICDYNKCIPCKSYGESCVSSRDCCDNNSLTGGSCSYYLDGPMTCIPRPSPVPTLVWPEHCLAPGSSCYHSDDSCCNNYVCKDKKCISPLSTPTPVIPKDNGSACTRAVECRSSICSLGICSPCAAIGEYCRYYPQPYRDDGDCCNGGFCYWGRCKPSGWLSPTPDPDRQQWGSSCTMDYSDTIGICKCDNQRCAKYVDGVLVNCVPAGGGPIGGEVSRCCSGSVSDGKCL
ncbi:TPA: hypothetical protein DD455_04915 [Candidatus Shapirobacteria bacterium]|nr:hypothetical protein [Candidatus Shapirobacteria bacterium]